MNFLSRYFSGKQIFRLILLHFIVCRKQIHRGVLLVSLQISEARKIPPQCLMSMMTPVYFPQFAQTTGEGKRHSPLICCSNGNHPGHNASSAFDNLRHWKAARPPLVALHISIPSKDAECAFKQQDTHSANKPH